MRPGSLIRRLRLEKTGKAARDPLLRGADAVFWLLLVLALGVGGERAVQGAPALASLLFPPGLIEAQADPTSDWPSQRVGFALRLPEYQSRYAPVVLTPLPSDGFPQWLRERVRFAREDGNLIPSAPVPKGPPVIAIVIDDLGADEADTRRAIALAKAVSLSFLPYPEATPALAKSALRAGHQVLVHVPMQPDGNADPGPMALTTDLSAEEIVRRLDWALDRVPGYSGVNNHMGSKFTADRAVLIPVMEVLSEKHVFFLDSRTTAASDAVTVARAFGVASSSRDVFLDDVETAPAIEAQLAQVEARARMDGVAIAIGHPHAVTLDVLAAWQKQIEARGFELVPVSVAIKLKTERGALLGLLPAARG